MSGLTIDDPAYFDRLADVERRHWWSLGMWRIAWAWLSSALRGRRGLTALDVGCGTGETVVRLSRIPAIARIVGLDASPEALSRSRRRHRFPLISGSATALPFRDDSFDAITCFDVLQHLEPGGDALAFREFARVLRPGGVAVIRANGRGCSGALAYRLETLASLAASAGLRVRRASRANCLPALAQEIRARLPRRSGGAEAIRAHPEGGGLRIEVPTPWLNQMMWFVATTEAILAGRLGFGLPFGHSTMLLVEHPEPARPSSD